MVIIDKLKKKFKQNEVLEKNEKEQTEETNTNLKDSLLDMIKQTIKKWDKNDIYAVSLYVYDLADNPCEPTVILGYNTNEKFASEMMNASNEQEAKWNYAFWLQNIELEFGIGETHKIVKSWIEQQGYNYYSYNEMFDLNNDLDESTYERITKDFVQVLVQIVKELHSSGFIEEQFGKKIPVLIHELEYYDEIAEQNIEANSKELVEEFVKFCIGE